MPPSRLTASPLIYIIRLLDFTTSPPRSGARGASFKIYTTPLPTRAASITQDPIDSMHIHVQCMQCVLARLAAGVSRSLQPRPTCQTPGGSGFRSQGRRDAMRPRRAWPTLSTKHTPPILAHPRRPAAHDRTHYSVPRGWEPCLLQHCPAMLGLISSRRESGGFKQLLDACLERSECVKLPLAKSVVRPGSRRAWWRRIYRERRQAAVHRLLCVLTWTSAE